MSKVKFESKSRAEQQQKANNENKVSLWTAFRAKKNFENRSTNKKVGFLHARRALRPAKMAHPSNLLANSFQGKKNWKLVHKQKSWYFWWVAQLSALHFPVEQLLGKKRILKIGPQTRKLVFLMGPRERARGTTDIRYFILLCQQLSGKKRILKIRSQIKSYGSGEFCRMNGR